ncbi:IPTL-CTERM sorting domain-containing protein [Ottowia thiooxydans]|uniref:IPTL-CTERM sorting domain-containing protein n=1 Tax=Ottowia thiooxydans TaxID=219182 RepID=UPI000421B131|nr:IPTL-CTERM sorting domain-containing protein [Ottowia thiooxydans]
MRIPTHSLLRPWQLALIFAAGVPTAHAVCIDTASRAQATAGDTCPATGTTYTGASNAAHTLLASGANSTLTISSNVSVNPTGYGSNGGTGVVSAGAGGHLVGQGSVTVIQAGALNSYAVSAGPVNPAGAGTVDIRGAVTVTMAAGGTTRRAVMANGVGSVVTIEGPITVTQTGGTSHRGLSAEGGGSINYAGASVDFRGDVGSTGIRVLTGTARLHGTGNTELWVEGAGSVGFLTNASAESTIDGWLKVHGDVGADSAASIQGAAKLTVGAGSLLDNTGGVAVRIGSANAEPLVAGAGLSVTASTGFLYAGAITPTTQLTDATVNAATLWQSTANAQPNFQANGGTYTGTSVKEPGSALSISLANSATWNLTSDASLTLLTLTGNGTLSTPNATRTVSGSITNTSGLVDLSGSSPQTGDALTVSGNYVGGGGTVRLDTALGDSSSPTDMFVVQGDATGTTSLDIRNLNGLGAATTGNGIAVATASGVADAGAFVLAGGPLTVGGFVYTLNQVGNTWYLQSRLIPPEASIACTPSELTDSADQVSTCTVTLSYSPTEAMSVNLNLPAASARYGTTCASPILIAANTSSATCTLTAVANTVAGDGDVTAELSIAIPTIADTYTVAGSPAQVIVRNDDVAVVTPVPPTPVPTLGQWAMMLLSLSLAGVGLAGSRRRPSLKHEEN